jgi:Kdo2-lipid IVA lauroyltransferase/acyltransferase
MQAVFFYLGLPFILLVSKLPQKVLYGISSYFVFPVLFYVLKYRRYVVTRNLKNAYPDKSTAELYEIEKGFYKYLSDLFLETVKSFTISKDQLLKRISYSNLELLDEYFAKNKNIIMTLGHIGNYEWIAKAMSITFKHEYLVPYRKMTNQHFDAFFRKSRMAFGADFFPTHDTFPNIKKKRDKAFLLTLANDQSAQPHKAYWVKFLNQNTSFFVGTEKVAQQFELPVVFAHVSVPKRGYYHVVFELISDQPNTETEGYIMNKHAEMLEKDILASPQNWLWSHKRWKHAMPEGIPFGFNITK